ncbi:MAG: hypothetical protein WBM44_00740 [Waterburya sp.]
MLVVGINQNPAIPANENEAFQLIIVWDFFPLVRDTHFFSISDRKINYGKKKDREGKSVNDKYLNNTFLEDLRVVTPDRDN